MGEVKLPSDDGKRRNIYSVMLGLHQNHNLTFNELEELCLKRGYLTKKER